MNETRSQIETANAEDSVAEAKWLLGPVLALFPLFLVIGMLAS
jgi:hypothetical protein